MRGRPRPTGRRPDKAPARELELHIDKLGSEGVGVARVEGQVVLQHHDARRGADRLAERSNDFAPGSV